MVYMFSSSSIALVQ